MGGDNRIAARKVKRRLAAAGLAALALALLAFGIAAGEPSDVLTKATKICLECVGIG